MSIAQRIQEGKREYERTKAVFSEKVRQELRAHGYSYVPHDFCALYCTLEIYYRQGLDGVEPAIQEIFNVVGNKLGFSPKEGVSQQIWERFLETPKGSY